MPQRLHSSGSQSLRLPMLSSSRGGHGHSQSKDKFSRLKAVLVSNLLKQYHKVAKSNDNDEAVYQLAMQEVERIMKGGRITESDLKKLQKRFATEIPRQLGLEVPSRNGSRAASRLDHPSLDSTRQNSSPRAEHGREDLKLNLDAMNKGNDNTSTLTKATKVVDEWTVMTLYNDVKHLEDQKAQAEKKRAEKERTRNMLMAQIKEREAKKKASKSENLHFYQSIENEYEAWREEELKKEEDKVRKANAERERLEKMMQEEKERKRRKQQAQIEEEKKELAMLSQEIEDEKAEVERQRIARNEHMRKVLLENEKELEYKRSLKDRQREEEVRMMEEMAEVQRKQEESRAKAMEAIAAKQKRIAQAAETGTFSQVWQQEREMELRILKEAEERDRLALEKETKKKQAAKEARLETMSVIADQLKEKKANKEKEVQEARELAKDYRRQAMELQQQQREDARKHKQRLANQRKLLMEQMEERKGRNHNQDQMTEEERRINAGILRRLVDDSSTLGGLSVRGDTVRPSHR